MRRIQTILKQKASEANCPLWIVEKDYALSYLLAGIVEEPILNNLLILKGGTALKKAYFERFRFSEDLDFSTSSNHNDLGISKSITHAVKEMENLLLKIGPFRVQSSLLELRQPHPSRALPYN